jgi:hypothetical protein
MDTPPLGADFRRFRRRASKACELGKTERLARTRQPLGLMRYRHRQVYAGDVAAFSRFSRGGLVAGRPFMARRRAADSFSGKRQTKTP